MIESFRGKPTFIYLFFDACFHFNYWSFIIVPLGWFVDTFFILIFHRTNSFFLFNKNFKDFLNILATKNVSVDEYQLEEYIGNELCQRIEEDIKDIGGLYGITIKVADIFRVYHVHGKSIDFRQLVCYSIYPVYSYIFLTFKPSKKEITALKFAVLHEVAHGIMISLIQGSGYIKHFNKLFFVLCTFFYIFHPIHSISLLCLILIAFLLVTTNIEKLITSKKIKISNEIWANTLSIGHLSLEEEKELHKFILTNYLEDKGLSRKDNLIIKKFLMELLEGNISDKKTNKVPVINLLNVPNMGMQLITILPIILLAKFVNIKFSFDTAKFFFVAFLAQIVLIYLCSEITNILNVVIKERLKKLNTKIT